MVTGARLQFVIFFPGKIGINPATVADHYAFGFTRGTRRVNHVSHVARRGGWRQILIAFFGDFRPVALQANECGLVFRNAFQMVFLTQQHRHLGIVNHVF